jgi:hypothetical protein
MGCMLMRGDKFVIVVVDETHKEFGLERIRTAHARK